MFNAIRLAIANYKSEIEVMKLVGASSWFITGPFLVQGVLMGVAAAFIVVLLFAALALAAGPKLAAFVSGFSLTRYFFGNLGTMILLQVAAGVGLGMFSSWLAVRKYLK